MNKTVLYVEDSPANMALMKEYFDGLDELDLLMAVTGEEGVDQALTHKPDLILMDINLPGISGIEALIQLRAIETTRHIPIIAISADAMSNDVRHALDAGFDKYLTKPIKLAELTALMYAQLDT